MPSLLNAGYPLAITPPEEGAGAAYDVAKRALLEPFGVEYVELPMDLATRVLSNSQAVEDASRFVKEHPTSTYVKGPGITPRPDQVLACIMHLEQAGALTFHDPALDQQVADLRAQQGGNLQAFAEGVVKLIKPIGSPNAKWRDALEANLSRGAKDEVAERSLVTPQVWTDATPLTVYAYPATEGTNRWTGKTATDTSITVRFIGADGTEREIGSQKLSAGSGVRLFRSQAEEVKSWLDDTLKQVAQDGAMVAHGTKQTVLKSDDTRIVWLADRMAATGLSDKVAPFAQKKDAPAQFNNLLVDDLFARLAATTPDKPLAIVAPNQSYADYVQEVWDAIRAKGGFKPMLHSEVVRASATGDHYKAIETPVTEAGRIQVTDASGAVLAEASVQPGDLVSVTGFDAKRAAALVKQALANAEASHRTQVLFGFDAEDPYYAAALTALESERGKYPGLQIRVLKPAEATAEYFTAGVRDTILVLGNIHGDFATDIEVFGKGTAYSTGTIYDGRNVVELGSGGTAPDLIPEWKETGVLKFNPMSFVEGFILALEFAAQNMKRDGKDASAVEQLAEAFSHGLYATMDQGIVPPIVKGKFKTRPDVTEYQLVGTHGFVASVAAEAIAWLHAKGAAGITDETVEAARARSAQQIAEDGAFLKGEAADKAGWRAACTAYHEARTIDPLNPDYTLHLPSGAEVGRISAATIRQMLPSVAVHQQEVGRKLA
jgi:hypothetical protein